MNNVLEDSLFVSQNRKFDEIQSIVRQFSAVYVGNSIIKDNIFAVIQNYARKKEIALELLRYPIHDDELWALTFLKQDTIFVCVNTALPLCKQFFAAAHELYHIYCYVENADQSYIKNGSIFHADGLRPLTSQVVVSVVFRIVANNVVVAFDFIVSVVLVILLVQQFAFKVECFRITVQSLKVKFIPEHHVPVFIKDGNQMKLIMLVFQIVDGTPIIGIFTCDVF